MSLPSLLAIPGQNSAKQPQSHRNITTEAKTILVVARYAWPDPSLENIKSTIRLSGLLPES